MSDFARQREALLSGFNAQTVTVPAINVLSSTVLAVPIGNPMDQAGTQRNALAPYVSIYAGLRPHVDFIALKTGGTVNVLIEAGITPYQVDNNTPINRQPRPLFVPLSDAVSVDFAAFPNQLGQRALLPWPPGTLQIRISFTWSMSNQLGDEVDVCVAWAAISTPAYNSLPAAEDSFDLQGGFAARLRNLERKFA